MFATSWLARGLTDDPRFVENLIWLGLLILSLSFHEYAHAWTAKRCGDDTAERLGRLTLNPIVHIDLFFTIVLPCLFLFGPLKNSGLFFGAAKPVPVVASNLRKPTRDMMLTSAAGPMMNVLLALFFTGAFWFHTEYRHVDTMMRSSQVVAEGIRLNLQLAFFNLLPIPPLDGHRVLGYILPARIRESIERVGLFGIVLLLALMYLGVFAKLFRHVFLPFADWWSRHLMPHEFPLYGYGF